MNRWIETLRRRWSRQGTAVLRSPDSAGSAPALEAWSDRDSFLALREGPAHERLKAQWMIRQHLPAACSQDGLDGICNLCGQRTRFGRVGEAASFDDREGLACAGCGNSARMRLGLALLTEGLNPASARVYLTEQASPGFVWLQRHFAGASGSEFGLDDTRRRRLQRWFEQLGGQGELCEADITALSNADATLDAIGCFDVLEHVPDYPAALREFARVLVPGGRLLLTLPFLETAQNTLVRASLHPDGRIEHHLPAEIHGDPVAGGVLCYYHFGWDLLEALRAAGFRRAEWLYGFAPGHGLFGVWVLRAER